MKRAWKRAGHAAFGLAVAAGLSFGASAAWAGTGAAAGPGCTDPSADTSCSTAAACTEYCLTTPPGSRGLCWSGCCYCTSPIYP